MNSEMGDNKYTRVPHIYKITPDITKPKYRKERFNDAWINNEIIFTPSKENNLGKILSDPIRFSLALQRSTKMGSRWVNNILYNKPLNDTGIINVYGIYEENKEALNWVESYDKMVNWRNGNDPLVFILKDNLLVIYSNILINRDKTNMTFKSVQNYLNNIDFDNNQLDKKLKTVLTNLKDYMNSAVSPAVVQFNKSLYVVHADSPDINSKEVAYYKDDKCKNYVVRYSGDIEPSFTKVEDKKNYLFEKDCIEGNDELRKSSYYSYVKSGFAAKYPSINYDCLLEDTLDYTKPSVFQIRNKTYEIVSPVEHPWFNNSTAIYTLPEIKFNTTGDEQLDEQIRNKIQEVYQTEDKDAIDYILSLYKRIYNLLETTEDGKYIYEIKLILK